MPLLDRIFSGDEELGKKDDDHRPGKRTTIPSSWVHRQSMPGFRQRRYFYALIAILFIYLFIKNLPTDIGPNSRTGGPTSPSASAQLASRPQPPTDQPPRAKAQSDAEKYYYEGQIKFYKLAVSLHAVVGMAGYNGANKNVLFAASGLKSASEIIPLACEMAKWKRNNVHFALMGRDDLDISEIQKLNGVNDDDCNIHWHGWGHSFINRSIVDMSLQMRARIILAGAPIGEWKRVSLLAWDTSRLLCIRRSLSSIMEAGKTAFL